ncbi:MAG: hypothetical protein NC434_14055 [Ruminococcus sp.]|nr:hypothetical protein [Ruminococcus sp.]
MSKRNEVEIMIENYSDIMKEIQGIKKKSAQVIERTTKDFEKRAPSWVAQEVVKTYNTSKKEVEKHHKGKVVSGTVKVEGVKLNNIGIVYKGNPLTITHFKMTPTKPPEFSNKRVALHLPGVGFRMVRQRKKIKVTATIFKGKKEIMRGDYSTPIFIQQNPRKAGQYLPFQRTGKIVEDSEKDELKTIKGPGVPQMIGNEDVKPKIDARIGVELGKRLDNHLKQAFK